MSETAINDDVRLRGLTIRLALDAWDKVAPGEERPDDPRLQAFANFYINEARTAYEKRGNKTPFLKHSLTNDGLHERFRKAFETDAPNMWQIFKLQAPQAAAPQATPTPVPTPQSAQEILPPTAPAASDADTPPTVAPTDFSDVPSPEETPPPEWNFHRVLRELKSRDLNILNQAENGALGTPHDFNYETMRMLTALRPNYANTPALLYLSSQAEDPLETQEAALQRFKQASPLFNTGFENFALPLTKVQYLNKILFFHDKGGNIYADDGNAVSMYKGSGTELEHLSNYVRIYMASRIKPGLAGETPSLLFNLDTGTSEEKGLKKMFGRQAQDKKMQDRMLLLVLHHADIARAWPDIHTRKTNSMRTGQHAMKRLLSIDISNIHPQVLQEMQARLGEERVWTLVDNYNHGRKPESVLTPDNPETTPDPTPNPTRTSESEPAPTSRSGIFDNAPTLEDFANKPVGEIVQILINQPIEADLEATAKLQARLMVFDDLIKNADQIGETGRRGILAHILRNPEALRQTLGPVIQNGALEAVTQEQIDQKTAIVNSKEGMGVHGHGAVPSFLRILEYRLRATYPGHDSEFHQLKNITMLTKLTAQLEAIRRDPTTIQTWPQGSTERDTPEVKTTADALATLLRTQEEGRIDRATLLQVKRIINDNVLKIHDGLVSLGLNRTATLTLYAFMNTRRPDQRPSGTTGPQ